MSKSQLKTQMSLLGMDQRFINNYFTPCVSFNNDQKIHKIVVLDNICYFIESSIMTLSNHKKERVFNVKYVNGRNCLSLKFTDTLQQARTYLTGYLDA